jgi:pimeloyl-ACP methyl ester carboxylesterase
MRNGIVLLGVLVLAFGCSTSEPATPATRTEREASPAPARMQSPPEPAPEPAPAPAPPPDGVAWMGGSAVRYAAYAWDDTRHPERAIVLVHGWASDRSVWDAQIEALAGAARVLAIDLPGHGESDLPEETLTMDLFAEAIRAVLDDAGIERAALVGHSNGTPTIRQFYRNYPKRTGALIVVDGALRRMFDDEAAAQFHASLSGENYKDFVTTMVEGMAGASPEPEALRDRILPMALETPHRTIVEAFDAGADPTIWIEDPITVPLLVVLAEAPFWTEAYERHVREMARSDVEYRTFGGVSHFVQIDAPDAFNGAVLGFLESIGFTGP